jgi:hypothetical protein
MHLLCTYGRPVNPTWANPPHQTSCGHHICPPDSCTFKPPHVCHQSYVAPVYSSVLPLLFPGTLSNQENMAISQHTGSLWWGQAPMLDLGVIVYLGRLLGRLVPASAESEEAVALCTMALEVATVLFNSDVCLDPSVDVSIRLLQECPAPPQVARTYCFTFQDTPHVFIRETYVKCHGHGSSHAGINGIPQNTILQVDCLVTEIVLTSFYSSALFGKRGFLCCQQWAAWCR